MSTKSDSEEYFEDAIDTLATEQQGITREAVSDAVLFRTQKLAHQSSIPPPMGPPPPLPGHFLNSPEHEQSPSLLNSPTSPVPPPLPPRRPAPRNIESPPEQILNNDISSSTVSAKSPDQQLYARQRGHAKTNSLDRGLSLAKCMKSGPFPPPTSSKSNSLTRGVSPSDVLPILDEQESQAQGVIQGVIQQVLSENASLAEEAEITDLKNKQVDENELFTPSTSKANENDNIMPMPIATKSPSSTSSMHRKMKSTGMQIVEMNDSSEKKSPHYENLGNPMDYTKSSFNTAENSSKSLTEQKLSVFGSSKKRIGEKQHRRSASDKSPTKMKAATPQQKSSTWEPNQKLNVAQKPDTIDPITRDVERRMSIKDKSNLSDNAGKKQNSSDANDASSSDEVFGRHTSVEHIRRFAHTYGVAASDYLRGTVQKVRQKAVNLTRSATRSGRKADIVGDENERNSSIADSDEISVANCISESLAVPGSTPLGRKMRSTNSAEPPSSARASAEPSTATTGICRPKNAKKGPFDFEQLQLVQELNHEHTGAIWCIKFSNCGKLLATAGQDRNVRVWVLHSQLSYFTSLRERYCREVGINLDYSAMQHIGNMRPELYDCMEEEESDSVLCNKQPAEEETRPGSGSSKTKKSAASSSSSFSSRPQSAGTKNGKPKIQGEGSSASSNSAVFSSKPFSVFRGHTADVLDLSWSPRNYFLLSGGMDRTVKLWHLTRNDCLCSFQHVDFVTCIAFMPKDDRYFISGSLDGKIRLWNIPEKRVAIWNEVEEQFIKFITAIAFVKNGKFVVVGTYSGRCFFYSTDQLKYHTVIDARSSKAKNSRNHGKITSLAVHGDKLLVTSNDSRIRIYDLRDMDLCCKFKGAQIEESHVRASFSPDGKFIVSGSEDNFIYLWRTSGPPSSLTVRKDRNHAWERIRAHQTPVTTAVFAPKPQLILSWLIEQQKVLPPLASSTPEPTRSAISPPLVKTAREENVRKQQPMGIKERYSNSVDRPFLTLASRLALPTANLTDLQLRRSKPSTASLGYSSSMLSIASIPSASDALGSAKDRRAMGDVIVSADLSGSLKVFVNITGLQAGASNFFPLL